MAEFIRLGSKPNSNLPVLVIHSETSESSILVSLVVRSLWKRGIHTFVDHEAVHESSVIERAINSAQVAVVVFSRDLFEKATTIPALHLLLNREPKSKPVVIPVFYQLTSQNYHEELSDTGSQELFSQILTKFGNNSRFQLAKLDKANQPKFVNDIITAVTNELMYSDKGKTDVIFNLPNPSRWLLGRSSEVDIIASAIFESCQSGSSSVLCHVIYGAPGVGKLQIAIKVVDVVLDQLFLVWHVDASTNYSVKQGLFALGKSVGILAATDILTGQADASLRKVTAFLEAFSQPWLLLLTDVNITISELHRMLPILKSSSTATPGFVLATAKHLTLSDDNSVIWKSQLIQSMNVDIGCQFLQMRLPKNISVSPAELQSVVREVAGLPLALSMAAGFMARTHTSPTQFLNAYFPRLQYHAQQRSYLTARRIIPCPDAIVAILDISLGFLPDIAKPLLQNLSLLASRNIPKSLLIDLSVVVNDQDLDSALSGLSFFSLIQSDGSNISTHTMIQGATLVLLPPSAHDLSSVISTLAQSSSSLYEAHLSACICIAEALLPQLIANSPSDALDLIKRITSIPAWDEFINIDGVARLLLSESEAMTASGQEDLSRQRGLLTSAMSLFNQHYGANHIEVVIAMGMLCKIAFMMGKKEESAAYLQEALGILKNNYSIDFFEAMPASAVQQGHFSHRRRSFVSVRVTMINKPKSARLHSNWIGPTDDIPRIVVALTVLLECVGLFGDEERKREMADKALQLVYVLYGKDAENLDVIRALENSARSKDHPSQREEMLQQALAMKEKLLGSDHIQLVPTLIALAAETPRSIAATELLERALALQEKQFGSEHVFVAKSLELLASIASSNGNSVRARALLSRALKIREKNAPSDKIGIATCLENMGNATIAIGEPLVAKDLLTRAIEIKTEIYGTTDHIEVARCQGNLANAIGALGDDEGKKEILERVLTIFERELGVESLQVSSVLSNLATAVGNLGGLQRKKDLLQRALAIKEKLLDPDDIDISLTLNNLANAIGALGDSKTKGKLLMRALAIKEKHYGANHFAVAVTLSNLAEALGELGDLTQEREMLESAISIEKKHYGPDHVEVARTLTKLAANICRLGDAAKAKSMLERALQIKQQHYSQDHIEIASTLTYLGQALIILGEFDRAKNLLERALAIKEQQFGYNHVNIASTITVLADAVNELGASTTARDMLKHAVALKEKHYGTDHIQVAFSLVSLGDALVTLNEGEEALQVLQRALRILTKSYTSEHVDLARAIASLGNAYILVNKHNDAISCLHKAQTVFNLHKFPPTHLYIKRVNESLAVLGPRRPGNALSRLTGKGKT